jgi:SNF2 family DNA or RNA helicase
MFKSENFQKYIESKTNAAVRESAKTVDLENLIVGKLGITAKAIESRTYLINIVLFQGKIHSTHCTCGFTEFPVCKHVIAVLKAAEHKMELDRAAAIDPSVYDNPHAHSSQYAFLNFSFDQLTTDLILKHISTQSSEYFRMKWIQKIEYGLAEIEISKTFYERQNVRITYQNDDLILECFCSKYKNHLCEHQEQAMYVLKDDPTVRAFFDPQLRQSILQQKVKDFGMQHESNLDDYFLIKWEKNELLVQPKIKGLLSLGSGNKERLSQDLSVSVNTPLEFSAGNKTQEEVFVVFSQEKYDDHFSIQMMTSSLTKEGKIKNPIRPFDAKSMIWMTEDPMELRFYAGIDQFHGLSSRFRSDKANAELELASLRAIVKNPSEYDIYCLDTKISENITASSLVKVDLRKVEVDFHLKVVQKDHFYEVTPKIYIDGSVVSYSRLKLVYSYFMRLDNELLFVADLDVLRVFSYLKKRNNKLLIHQSKFDEFRTEILANLESKVSIDYSFLKPATPQQLSDSGFEEEVKKLIYLSESEDYVLLTPVMRYGSSEVAIRSKSRIYAVDAVGEAFEVERDERAEINLLLTLNSQHPTFADQDGFDYYYLHKKHFLDEGWFLDAFEVWKQDGIEVLGFSELKNNSLSPSKMKVVIGVSSGIDWFETAVSVSFGENEVRLKDIQRSIHNQSRYVKLGDGRLGMLPQEWVDKFSTFFRTGEVHGNAMRTAKIHFSVIDELFEDEVLSLEVSNELAVYRQKLKSFQHIEKVAIPKKLKATLRDYQKEGLNWLNFLDEFNFGGCLADDMGLGKTVQILAFILALKEKNGQRTHLIVLPTSLLFNWKIELEKFAPSLKFHTIYGFDRKKEHEGLEKFDIIFTTYGTLLSDITFLRKFEFDYIFLDESQAIKNPESKRYKAVRLLQARNRVVLTGTPIENNTFDLYAQFSFASPGLLGNQQHFKDNYSIPIDKFKDGMRAKELQRKLSPFLLRRTKKQVATELPEKTEMVIYCEMGKEQRKVYDSYKNEFKLYLQNTKADDLLNKSMHILQGLTKLRQICNSPAILSDDEYYGEESSKMKELMEQIETQSGQHKILVFSQFVTMLDLIRHQLDEREIRYAYLTGQTKDRAGKVKHFQEDEETRVFLISLKAGGVGLNLTEADYVFIVDPWWNPAVENQAIDRCYRIGQKKNVMAIRLICPDTIEEKILHLKESKMELIDDLIKVDAHGSKSLSKEDILDLLD